MEIIGRNDVREWPLDEGADLKFQTANVQFFSLLAMWEGNNSSHAVRLKWYVREWGGRYLMLEATGSNADDVQAVNDLIEQHFQPFALP